MHEPIVDDELFEAVHRRLHGGRRARSTRRLRLSAYPLSGLEPLPGPHPQTNRDPQIGPAGSGNERQRSSAEIVLMVRAAGTARVRRRGQGPRDRPPASTPA
ncbi:hypothetical protein [Jiangella endophytica]|uniref:hypothetical protein n=1 Tax=Jiangella endophytica TaxID=1623398 RepID=UPI0013002CBC|nr:hypothetical protein [Jiangella endophytica]